MNSNSQYCDEKRLEEYSLGLHDGVNIVKKKLWIIIIATLINGIIIGWVIRDIIKSFE